MLGLFGFSKELTTRIGCFDEGYVINGFEDTDWMNKLFVNNLGFYVSTETTYLDTGTSWGNASHKNAEHYYSKWKEDMENNIITQLRNDVNAEDKHLFEGLYKTKDYLPWCQSELKAENIKQYYHNKSAVKEV